MDSRIATLLLSGLAGLVVAALAGVAAYFGWLGVGVMTGVIAPCSTAPLLWGVPYFLLFPIVVVGAAVGAAKLFGHVVGRRLRNRLP